MDLLQAFAQLPTVLIQIQASLDANTLALKDATEQLGNTRYYEADAAHYLGVESKTMYHYRQKGLVHEKVGRVISYLRKDLDAWRKAGHVRGNSAAV